MTNEELKALAKAATPGPWRYDGSYVCPSRAEGGTTYVETWRSVADCNQPENTHFIAAANPAAVLGLIADLEKFDDGMRALAFSLGAGGYNAATLTADQLIDKVNAGLEMFTASTGRLLDKVTAERDALKDELARSNAAHEAAAQHQGSLNTEIYALKAECEGLRKALSECTTSLEGEMLQKFHGQKPEDMHPVTRREYDRDMEELAGYRAALGQGGQSND